jgi:DNA-binding MarR family transcriptional regulator
MEKRGLVKRVKKTKTTKATSVVMTEKGIKAAEKAACHDSILKLFQTLTQEELDVLERSLLKRYHASEEMNAVER